MTGPVDYTEQLVLSMVTMQLVAASFPLFNVQVIPLSTKFEQITGADAKVLTRARFSPIYLQFKRPNFTAPNGEIARTRQVLVPGDPNSLHFNLRKKSKRAKRHQHNALFNLRKCLSNAALPGDAVYVCSLDRNTDSYIRNTCFRFLRSIPSALFNGRQECNDLAINELVKNVAVWNNFQLPWLSGHVCIPPHRRVTTHRHSYSFNYRGEDVCFHSREKIENGNRSLFDWFANVATSVRRDGGVKMLDSKYLLDKLQKSLGLTKKAKGFGDSSVASEWLSFGDKLADVYGIEQFGILVEEKLNISE